MGTFCDQHRQKHTHFIVYARASFLCNLECRTLGLACSKSQNDAATFLFFLAIRSHWFSISNFILYSSGEDFIAGKTGIIAFCFYRPATIFSLQSTTFFEVNKMSSKLPSRILIYNHYLLTQFVDFIKKLSFWCSDFIYKVYTT